MGRLEIGLALGVWLAPNEALAEQPLPQLAQVVRDVHEDLLKTTKNEPKHEKKEVPLGAHLEPLPLMPPEPFPGPPQLPESGDDLED